MENFEKTEKKPKKKKESMPLSAIVVGIIVAFFGLKVISGEATIYDNNGNLISSSYQE